MGVWVRRQEGQGEGEARRKVSGMDKLFER